MMSKKSIIVVTQVNFLANNVTCVLKLPSRKMETSFGIHVFALK